MVICDQWSSMLLLQKENMHVVNVGLLGAPEVGDVQNGGVAMFENITAEDFPESKKNKKSTCVYLHILCTCRKDKEK